MRVERIGGATLYCGDNAEIAATLPRSMAVVTDPPYGINYCHGARKGGKRQGTDGMAIVGDDKPFDPSLWLGFSECLFWGAEHFKHVLPVGGRWLVWDKRRVGVVRDQGCVENAWHSVAGVTRIFRHPWDGADMGQERGEARVHSNQKPVDLMRWCVEEFISSKTVFDPFAGSGSTGVACARLGRSFVGIEIDPAHFDTMCKRIEAAQRQPDMFVSQPKAAVQEALL